MKRVFLVLFFISPFIIFSQSLIPRYKTMMDSLDDYTFYDIQNEAEFYFANRDKGRGSGYKQYKRWAIFAEERFAPSGNMFNIGATNLANYQAYITSFNFNVLPLNYDPGYWSQVNTGLSTQSPHLINDPSRSSNPGVGRVQCIEIAGSDCYIGTPGGGIWKNSVSGSWVDWVPIGDGLPQIGISDIEVNPTNSNNIFILTGEAEQTVTTNESIGVLESNDGGLTWHATSLSWDVNELVGATRLLMHPTNPNIQFVTVRRPVSQRGIYKTTDGWNSWTKVFSGSRVYDIEFKPGDPSIVYAATNNDFLRSTSNGDSATFNIITNGLPSNPGTDRIAIGVSPDDADYVYLLYADNNGSTATPCSVALSPFDGFYRSTTSGVSFTLRDSGCPNPLGYSSTGNDNREQATYDLTVAVNPTNVDEVHIGGINCWMSTSGGSSGSWTITSWWDRNGTASIPFTFGYTHADIHALEFNNSTGKLYCASDGGFYRRSGGVWSDRSNGLMNMQFYNIDIHNSDNIAIGGTQDNGGNLIDMSLGTLRHEIGADGIAAQIDQSDNDTWFLSSQSTLYKTSDGGTTYNSVYSGTLWRSEVVIHPTNNQIVYISDDEDLYRSTTGGGNGSFSRVLNLSSTTSRLVSTTHGVSFTNRLYTTTSGGTVLMSSSGGGSGTWNTKTSPGSGQSHTDIVLNPDHSRHVWVTVSGYSDGNKVYYSNDTATTWTNISGSLPNVPINCLVVDPDRTDHSVYIGTDVGVFYRDDNLSDWVPFFHGLPNVIIKDLEIANGEICAGTFGRGMWKSDLYGNCNTTYSLTNSNIPSTSQSNMSQYYAASDWITSSRTIYSSIADSVRYKGGNYVKLLPGFNTQSGANFEAKIGDCDGGGGSSVPPANYMSAQQAIIYRCYGTLVP